MPENQSNQNESSTGSITVREAAMMVVRASAGKRSDALKMLETNLTVFRNFGFAKMCREMKKIMLEEPAEISDIAASWVLELDPSDQTAINHVVAVLDGEEPRRIMMAKYLARLPRVPKDLVASLEVMLKEPDRDIRLTAAVALRDASEAAMGVLTVAYREANVPDRILAARAICSVAERARQDISNNEIAQMLIVLLETRESIDPEDLLEVVSLLYIVGPVAANAVPILLEILMDQALVRPETRTLILRFLGSFAERDRVVDILVQGLDQAIQRQRWLTLLMIIDSLTELNAVSALVLDKLTKLLYTPDRDSQQNALLAFKALGMHAAPAIPALVAWVGEHNDKAEAEAWAKTIGYIGPAVISPLLQLVRTADNLYVVASAVGALTLAGEDALNAIVNHVLTDPDAGIRSMAAAILHSRGKRALSALPEIVKLLESNDGEKYLDGAVLALKGFGPSGREAIPALVRFFKSGDPITRDLAKDGLINIGPEVASALRGEYRTVEPRIQQEIRQMLALWNLDIDHRDVNLEWLKKVKYLPDFLFVLQILKEEGPTFLNVLVDRLARSPLHKRKITSTGIGQWRNRLEERYKAMTGRSIELVESQSGKPWKITHEGETFLNEARYALKS
jgi:hypothetical protein